MAVIYEKNLSISALKSPVCLAQSGRLAVTKAMSTFSALISKNFPSKYFRTFRLKFVLDVSINLNIYTAMIVVDECKDKAQIQLPILHIFKFNSKIKKKSKFRIGKWTFKYLQCKILIPDKILNYFCYRIFSVFGSHVL